MREDEVDVRELEPLERAEHGLDAVLPRQALVVRAIGPARVEDLRRDHLCDGWAGCRER